MDQELEEGLEMKPNFLSLRAVILWFSELQFLRISLSWVLGEFGEMVVRIIARQ